MKYDDFKKDMCLFFQLKDKPKEFFVGKVIEVTDRHFLVEWIFVDGKSTKTNEIYKSDWYDNTDSCWMDSTKVISDKEYLTYLLKS